MISSTGSQHFIVKYDDAKEAVGRRKYRPLFLIDIAVPRDVDPRCDTLQNVYLFTVDDLEKVVAANRKARMSEATRAEVIVHQEVRQLMDWMRQTEVVPTIVSLRQKLTSLKKAELERMLRDNPDLTPEARAAAERMAHSLINKVLHEPTVSLRAASNTGHHNALVVAARSLFALGEDDPTRKTSKEGA
jgi:glutamyl-tRNA reductase